MTIEFKGIDAEGDACFHLEFPNGAILSYSTYGNSVLAWWKDTLDEIPLELTYGVDAYLFAAYAAAISQMAPQGKAH